MKNAGKIISLDSYRENRSSADNPKTNIEQSDARYTAEEQAIIDRLNHPHPAGKKLAFDKLVEQPDLMVRYIEDKLRANGYSEDEINAVRGSADYTKRTDANVRPEELSQALYMEHLPLMQVSLEDNQRRSAEFVDARTRAEAARTSFKLIDGQKSQDN